MFPASSSEHCAVLLVEPSDDLASTLESLLREQSEQSFVLVRVASIDETADVPAIDAVLLSLPESVEEGLVWLAKVFMRYGDVPVFILCDDDVPGVRAMRQGAEDYLIRRHLDGVVLARTLGHGIGRRRAAFQLREREEQLRLAIEAGGLGTWEWRLHTGEVRWSATMERIHGMSVGSFDGSFDSYKERIHPEDRERVLATQQRVIQERRTSYRLEYRTLTVNGEVKWLETRAKLHLDAEGEPRRVVGVSMDVTERKRAEHALRESQQSYRTVLDSLTETVYILDSELRFVDVSAAVRSMYGYESGELVGRTPEFLIDSRHMDVEEGLENLRAAFAGQVSLFEWWGRKKSGESILMEAAVTRATYFGQDVLIVVGRDITERRHLEEQLRQSQKMEAVGRLAGGIAHDFNNLLQVIGGNVELLADEVPPTGPAHEELEGIGQAVRRAESLTRQLLAFSRKQILHPEVVEINEWIVHSGNMIRRLIGEDIEVELSLSPNAGVVEVDRGQLDQVLINLAVNARDAMPRGGMLRISTRSVRLNEQQAEHQFAGARAGDFVQITVQDTGHGMDEATLSRIFEPFFTTKEQGKGTGLGLSTVYGIVEQSGGHVTAESTPGAGTTFRILLPALPVQEKAPPAPSADAMPGGHETILVVEDEDAVRRVLSKTLRRYGYQVVEADSAEVALEVFRRSPQEIDLLITDAVMPRSSGLELVERMWQIRPVLPVLCLSGYSEEALQLRGLGENGPRLLQKPVAPAQLLQAVREVLSSPAGAGKE